MFGINLFSRVKPIINTVYSTVASVFVATNSTSQEVTPDSAMKFTTIYSCVKVLSESVATLPLYLYQETKNKRNKQTNKLTRLLDNPNRFMSSFDFKSMVIVDLCLRGNSYWQIVRNKGLEVTGIYPLLADQMMIKVTEGGKVEYHYASTTQGLVVLADEEVLHFKMLSMDGIVGISPIAYNKLAISLGVSQLEYSDKFYQNGSNSAVVLSHPATLDDEAYNRLKSSFTKQYVGVKNSHKPILLEDGLKMERLSITNAEAQYIESRTFTKNDIASIFRVPPHMINEMSRATFSNIEHQSLEFVKYTLMPYMVMIETELNNKLTSSDKQYFKFYTNYLVRGDIKTRYEAYQIAIQNGFLNRNEVRALEDLDYAEGLDEFIVPLNMQNVTKTGQENNGDLTTQGNSNAENNA